MSLESHACRYEPFYLFMEAVGYTPGEHCPTLQTASHEIPIESKISNEFIHLGSTLCYTLIDNQLSLHSANLSLFSAGKDFYVACYDWRTNPYVDVVTNGPHLELAKNLVVRSTPLNLKP